MTEEGRRDVSAEEQMTKAESHSSWSREKLLENLRKSARSNEISDRVLNEVLDTANYSEDHTLSFIVNHRFIKVINQTTEPMQFEVDDNQISNNEAKIIDTKYREVIKALTDLIVSGQVATGDVRGERARLDENWDSPKQY